MSGRGPVGAARVYDQPAPGEGTRILVDRLWPRGVRKDDPRIGRWLPAVAPSTELRRWYGHQPDRLAEFRARYLAELDGEPAAAQALDQLRAAADAGAVLLVTGTKELGLSHLPVLIDRLNAEAD